MLVAPAYTAITPPLPPPPDPHDSRLTPLQLFTLATPKESASAHANARFPFHLSPSPHGPALTNPNRAPYTLKRKGRPRPGPHPQHTPYRAALLSLLTFFSSPPHANCTDTRRSWSSVLSRAALGRT